MFRGASWRPGRQGAAPAGLAPGAGRAAHVSAHGGCPWSRRSPGALQQLPVQWGWQPLRGAICPGCRPAGGREAAAETGRRAGARTQSGHPNLLSRPCPNTGPRPSQGAAQPYHANAETTGAGGDPRGTGGDTSHSSYRRGLQKPLGGLLMSSK